MQSGSSIPPINSGLVYRVREPFLYTTNVSRLRRQKRQPSRHMHLLHNKTKIGKVSVTFQTVKKVCAEALPFQTTKLLVTLE